MVDVCLLGTQGGMPMVDKFMSSTIISYGGHKILLDCGEGTQIAMRKFGTGFKNIDVICISHSHGDHTLGLPGLLGTMGNSGRLEPVTIIGPKGITEVVKGLNVINRYLPYEINIIEGTSRNIIRVVEGVEISTIELEHSDICIGFGLYFVRTPKFSVNKAEKNNVPKILWSRLQKGELIEFNKKKYTPKMVLGEERDGIKISYITDTRPIDKIIKFIYKSNLFICEGTYGDDNDIEKAIKNKHMTFREAAVLAKKGECKELFLTHFTPAMSNPLEYANNAKEVFLNSVIAYDGISKTIKY